MQSNWIFVATETREVEETLKREFASTDSKRGDQKGQERSDSQVVRVEHSRDKLGRLSHFWQVSDDIQRRWERIANAETSKSTLETKQKLKWE